MPASNWATNLSKQTHLGSTLTFGVQLFLTQCSSALGEAISRVMKLNRVFGNLDTHEWENATHFLVV